MTTSTGSSANFHTLKLSIPRCVTAFWSRVMAACFTCCANAFDARTFFELSNTWCLACDATLAGLWHIVRKHTLYEVQVKPHLRLLFTLSDCALSGPAPSVLRCSSALLIALIRQTSQLLHLRILYLNMHIKLMNCIREFAIFICFLRFLQWVHCLLHDVSRVAQPTEDCDALQSLEFHWSLQPGAQRRYSEPETFNLTAEIHTTLTLQP